jgi:16S rRNA (cytosine1402-N4)-methyltransferase
VQERIERGLARRMATLTYMPSDHVPVLAAELIALVDPQPEEVVVDCTFGGGGHARTIAERIGPAGTLIAIGRDPAAAARFAKLGPELECEARFERGDFADVLAELAAEAIVADAVYFDLGISSLQLDTRQRGFSYVYDAPLDMRMDPGERRSAREVVNEWPEERLAETIRDLGEERHARAIAHEIVRRRPLETTAELAEAIRDAVPASYRFGRGHPAKRTFQAIRIAVNAELESLDRALPLAWNLLRPGGRLAAISFHSLEDRRVKRFLADRARGCVCPPELPVCQCGGEPEAELLTRRAVAPTPAEVEANPRARSAHLRVARKLAVGGDR